MDINELRARFGEPLLVEKSDKPWVQPKKRANKKTAGGKEKSLENLVLLWDTTKGKDKAVLLHSPDCKMINVGGTQDKIKRISRDEEDNRYKTQSMADEVRKFENENYAVRRCSCCE